MLFHMFTSRGSGACVFDNSLVQVSVGTTDIVHVAQTTFEMIYHALFAYDLLSCIFLRLRPRYAGGNLKTVLSFSSQAFRPHYATPQKLSLQKTHFRPVEFENCDYTVRLSRARKHLKTEVYENDEVTIIITFSCPSCTQTQTQNDR